ncbi:MAG TPA: DUF3395 domain-containing protein [Phycisphaerae bacterium]|jgi:hypothetical protein
MGKYLKGIGIAAFCVVLALAFFSAGFLLNPPAPAPPETRAADSKPAPEPPKPAYLAITKAVYGDLPDGPQTDVTKKVADLATRRRLSVAASNDLFGDPASGIVKKLRVDYEFGDLKGSRTVGENDVLLLAFGDRSGPLRLVIRKAVYGDAGGGTSEDLTQLLASMADNDGIILPVNYGSLGDPAPTQPKVLRVEYRFDGADGTATVQDGETLKLGMAAQ